MEMMGIDSCVSFQQEENIFGMLEEKYFSFTVTKYYRLN